VKKNSRKRRKKSGSFTRLHLLSLLVILAFGISFAFFLYSHREQPEPPVERTGPSVSGDIKKIDPPPRAREDAPRRFMALVIDDIGYDMTAVDTLLALNIPITFSVLPHCPYSAVSARRAHEAGHEVILHLPMEPLGYPDADPGEGALLVGMTRREILKTVESNLRSVPYISGVNNHMGSRFMEHEDKLIAIFSELKKRRLFFLDSLTSPTTKGRSAANTVAIDYITRDIFLDNSRNREDTFKALLKLLDMDNHWTTLVVIGHPYPSTLEALERALPYFAESDIETVPLSHIINRCMP